jgi:hypothetical protein
MGSGDRVRLRDDLVRRLIKRGGRKVNWRRTGRIVTVGRTSVTVRWDGRSSMDSWPASALVLVREPAEA